MKTLFRLSRMQRALLCYNPKMRIRLISILPGWLAILMLWAAVIPASANSAPPPNVVWFYFELASQPAPDGAPPFDGLQLQGCNDPTCAAPVLLQQTGRCEVAGCLTGSPIVPQSGPADWSRLECYGERCRSQSYSYARPYFRLAVQPTGGGALLLSGVEELPGSFMQRKFWRVTLAGDQLTLTPAEEIKTPSPADQPFWAHYLLTVGVELFVAALVWAVGLRGRIRLYRLLVMVGLATSLTYPVVYFSPALAPFSHASERTLLETAAITSVVIAGLFWAVFALALWPGQADDRARLSRGQRWALGLSAAALLLTCLAACPFFFIMISYGMNYQLAAAGIAPAAAIGLAEVYAFGLEALCYRLWSRGAVSWRWALLLSLLANLASLGLGLLLL